MLTSVEARNAGFLPKPHSIHPNTKKATVLQNPDAMDAIRVAVSEGLPLLKPHIQSWLRDHLIEPRAVLLATDTEGNIFKQLWLVTDHVGKDDSSYRIVYDAMAETFGLECTLNTGVEWYMGNYGSFFEAAAAM